MTHYDIIIIGTGAGGGTIINKLKDSGKKILVLERGDFLPREKENWDTEEVFLNARYKAKETWTDKNGKTFHPGIHYWVGGNTKVYGAALLRLRKQDFEEVHHHGGISPAWPIGYTDFSDYYYQAEQMYHVHGERGIDPTEPEEDRPYRYHPLPHEPRIQKLYDDLKYYGLRPYPLPIGVKMPENDGKLVLDRFDGFPDPTGSKGDAQVIGVTPALENENVSLVTNALVDKLVTDEKGKNINGVQAQVNGQRVTYQSDMVIMACGAINSAALLLNSANEKHPNGLANSSDVVGRHYMAHNNSAVLAISKTPNPSKFGKTIGINDYYFKGEDFDYPMGHIQMLGKSDPVMFKEDAPSFAPGFTLDYISRHALDFWITSEDLPDPENRVRIDRQGNISLHYTENNLEGHQRLQKQLKYLLEHLDCHQHIIPNHLYLGKKIPLAGTAHQCGTVRFGKDPRSSALDINCKAHDLENLYVVDGSFFPSSAAVNPGLTIMANALRVGDHLLERMK